MYARAKRTCGGGGGKQWDLSVPLRPEGAPGMPYLSLCVLLRRPPYIILPRWRGGDGQQFGAFRQHRWHDSTITPVQVTRAVRLIPRHRGSRVHFCIFIRKRAIVNVPVHNGLVRNTTDRSTPPPTVPIHLNVVRPASTSWFIDTLSPVKGLCAHGMADHLRADFYLFRLSQKSVRSYSLIKNNYYLSSFISTRTTRLNRYVSSNFLSLAINENPLFELLRFLSVLHYNIIRCIRLHEFRRNKVAEAIRIELPRNYTRITTGYLKHLQQFIRYPV